MSNLIIIIGNDDPILFFDSSAAPLFISLSMGRDKNITVRRFVFCVWCSYCELMFCLLGATCTVRMSFSCQFISVFLHMSFYLFHFPPHFLFFSLLSHSLLFMAFHLLRALLPHLSYSPFFLFFGKFSMPLILHSCFHGRLFLGLVKLSFGFFFLCSLVWPTQDCS